MSLARGSCTSFCEASQPGPQALEPPDQPHCSPWKPGCALGFPPRLPHSSSFLPAPPPRSSFCLSLPCGQGASPPRRLSTSLAHLRRALGELMALGRGHFCAPVYISAREGEFPCLGHWGGVELRLWKESVQFSRSVMSDSLRLHGLQHTRPPCPSPTPGAYSFGRNILRQVWILPPGLTQFCGH